MNRINKFYIFLAVLVLFLGGILVYSVKTVIDAFATSKEIDQGERLVTIDEQKLEEVYNWSFNRENISLMIRDINQDTDSDNEQETDDEEENE